MVSFSDPGIFSHLQSAESSVFRSFQKEVKQAQERQRMKQDPNYVPDTAKDPITDDEHMADVAATIQANANIAPTCTMPVSPPLPGPFAFHNPSKHKPRKPLSCSSFTQLLIAPP